MKIKIFIIISFFSLSASFAETEEQNYLEKLKKENELNFSQTQDSVNSFISTLSYSQEKKDKKFIGKLNIPINKDRSFFFNADIITSEVSDGIGPVGMLNIFGSDQTSMAKGAHLSVGLTWSNQHKLLMKATDGLDNKIYSISKKKRIFKAKDLNNFKEALETKNIYNHYKYILRPKYEKLKIKIKRNKENKIENFKLWIHENLRDGYKERLREIVGFLIQRGVEDELSKIKSISGLKTMLLNKISELEFSEDEELIVLELLETLDFVNERVEVEIGNELANRPDIINTRLENLPAKDIKRISDDINNKIAPFWIISFSLGANFTEMEYLSKEDGYEKLKDSHWGSSIKFSLAYAFNSKSLVGFTVKREETYKLPPSRNIIQELTTENGISTIPQTWESKTYFLEPMKEVKHFSCLMELRTIFLRNFTFNPIYLITFQSGKVENIGLNFNFLASLDVDRKWNIGIQPSLYWIKNERENFTPNFGIGIFLTTALRIFDSQ